MSYFKDAKVGDKVWDYIYGEGEIIEFQYIGRDKKQFIVDFGDGFSDVYNMIGQRICDAIWKSSQRLFYYDNRPTVITQGETPEFVKDIVKEETLTLEMLEKINEQCKKHRIKPIDIGGKKYYKIYEKDKELYFDVDKLSPWFLRNEFISIASNIEQRVSDLERRLDEI